MENTKKCPYCSEEILAVAIKCKYCKSMLDSSIPTDDSTQKIQSPTLEHKKTEQNDLLKIKVPNKKISIIIWISVGSLLIIGLFWYSFKNYETFYSDIFSTATDTDQKIAITELTIDRPTYQMKYYSDCTIDSSDTDFNLDNQFTINTASECGSITFIIYSTVFDEQECIDDMVKQQLDDVIKNGAVTYFNYWGKFKGHGATIKGKLDNLNVENKIFVHSDEKGSFLSFYYIYDEDREQDLPGLKLIETTFELK